MSPLRGTKDVKFVSSSDELVKALNSIKTNQQNNFDSERYFWLNSDLKKWKKLLYS